MSRLGEADYGKAEAAVRRFIERAEDKEDARIGMVLTGILTTHDNLVRENDHLREQNGSLRRKMDFLERRARSRMHGLVDLFTTNHDDE